MMAVIWLVILVLLVVIELLTMGLTTIWFAGGALVATICALLSAPIWLQLVLFVVVSAVLLFFTRPIAMRYLNRDRTRTNVESMIGRQAIVISEVNNLEGVGKVNVGGMEWSARTSQDGIVLAPGAVVNIVAVDGVKLIVTENGGD